MLPHTIWPVKTPPISTSISTIKSFDPAHSDFETICHEWKGCVIKYVLLPKHFYFIFSHLVDDVADPEIVVVEQGDIFHSNIIFFERKKWRLLKAFL